MTLPKLPRSKYTGMQHQRCYIGIVYTQEQMRAYAEKAVAAEREKFLAFLRQIHDAYALISVPPRSKT